MLKSSFQKETSGKDGISREIRIYSSNRMDKAKFKKGPGLDASALNLLQLK